MATHNKIGKIGEEIACRFLRKHGFSIVERNYTKKWGEIDIVAEKQGILHFVEVKTVSCENLSRETVERKQPEEMVHPDKQKRLARAIQTYISGNVPSASTQDLADRRETQEAQKEQGIEWQCDIIAVFLDQDTKQAKVRFTGNIILST